MSNDPYSGVATQSGEVSAMAVDWRLVTAINGGTRAMRAAGEAYLPKRKLETDADHKDRVAIATLFPAYSETIQNMTGRAFAKPLTTNDDVPAWVRDEVLPDVDMQGRNLHTFVRDWFIDALNCGLSHVIIDAPAVAGVRTQAEQKAARIRPYAILIKPDRVLGWRVQNGQLVQLRVSFTRIVEDGSFATKSVDQVRVYERGKVTIFERNAAGNWVPSEELQTGFEGIPIATIYTGRTGFMVARPPLIELAHLNAKHWRMQSSNDTLIDTVQVPILATVGLDMTETDGKIVIGAKHAVNLPMGADMKYVEHTGQAVGCGRTALDELKAEMRQAGAKLLEPRTASANTNTRAQASNDVSRENSALGEMVMNTEDATALMLDIIASYRGNAKGGTVTMQPNLDPDQAPAESMKVINDMRTTGGLSDQTAFNEAKRRGFVDDSIKWEDEQARIAAQGVPPVPAVGE